jgi:hypothetical protein
MSGAAALTEVAAPRRGAAKPFVAAAAMLLLGAGALWLGGEQGWRMGTLWLLGAALGLTLYHASFGFAAAFRALLAERRTAGLRAQMLMLGAAVLLMQPAIAAGELFGLPVRGFVFPTGVGVLVGAFLFGIGMQLGGGCASGTLYAVGGGGLRNLLTLGCFIAGATLAAWQAEFWQGWPALPAFSLPAALGLWPAIALALGVFALVWLLAAWLERRRHGRVEPIVTPSGAGLRPRLLSGPWPLAWGALALALLNFATLALAGRPWAITAAFPLWGSLAVEGLGWDDPVFWSYWEEPTRAEALLRPLAADRITVMDLGLVGGALLAAALAGRFAPDWRIGTGPAAASVVGGMLLGIGAVLAFGCNISAFFSGIASGSLHGWAWIGPALLGNWVGLRLRPAFRLTG